MNSLTIIVSELKIVYLTNRKTERKDVISRPLLTNGLLIIFTSFLSVFLLQLKQALIDIDNFETDHKKLEEKS